RAQGVHAGLDLEHQLVRSVGRRARQGAGEPDRAAARVEDRAQARPRQLDQRADPALSQASSSLSMGSDRPRARDAGEEKEERPAALAAGDETDELPPGFAGWRETIFSLAAWRRHVVWLVAALLSGGGALLFHFADSWGAELIDRLHAVSPWIPFAMVSLGMVVLCQLRDHLFPGTDGTGIPQAIAALKSKDEA